MIESHADAPATVRVVLFSGGRGSGVLSKQLLKNPRVDLTLAINGYDDGASTGEIRRFLGDSLGPSDYRKNASRLALELATCPPPLVEMLDARLPDGLSRDDAVKTIRGRAAGHPAVAERVEAFVRELESIGKPFNFNDCSVGNLVFAGSFLRCGRNFNAAIDDYCGLLGLAPGAIENVTDGANADLVAIGEDGAVLTTEEAIVGALGRNNRIREIYLVTRLTEGDRTALATGGAERAAAFFEAHRATVRLNRRLAERLMRANLIIYAPGTQHSSLFPSYLTPGLSDVIAGNLRAIKLLITNIQTDAEIAGSSAVDLIDKALFYLNDKGRRHLPTPCLFTHYVVNDPGRVEDDAPYVPLGHIEALEDPRLMRIANYEEGVTGRHDAQKLLDPFVQSLIEGRARQSLALLLHDAGSMNKVTQTLLEMVRGHVASLDLDITVFYVGDPLDRGFLGSLPFAVRAVPAYEVFDEALRREPFDYVMLFESSGMYRGEDVGVLGEHLTIGRLDAVWGSRRLSARDIAESIRFRYQKNPIFGAISAAGSQTLSLACLMLYGRFISDTLSAVRVVRREDALSLPVPLTHKRANHHLLARILGRRAELLEIPVQFFPISPERVKRTTIGDGLAALGTLVAGRFRRDSPASAAVNAAPEPTDKRRPTPAATR